MKYLFYVAVIITLFFSLSAGNMTPAIVVNHDKISHFIVFFILSLFMNISFPTQTIKKIFVVMISLAVSIEVAQYLFTNRELSIIDIGASIAGVIGCMIMLRFTGRKADVDVKISNVS